MYVLLSDDKHWSVQDSLKSMLSKALEIWDKIQSETNFFPDKKKFVSDWILSQITYHSCNSYAII